MNRDSYFSPSDALQAKCSDFLTAMKAEVVMPPGANPDMLRLAQMQVAVHAMLQTFDRLMVAEDPNVSEESIGIQVKAAMTGIGVGLASYLAQTSAPEFFFEHIVVSCHRSLAEFTKTEGSMN